MRFNFQILKNSLPKSYKKFNQSELWNKDKLHLGCGSNLLEGWVNLDLDESPGVVSHDLTKNFPIESCSISFIYSEHFIEHITRQDALSLLQECHRVLKPNGVLRCSTPNLSKLVDEYLKGKVTEWLDVGWSPSTTCQMLNEGLRLWGHQFVYDLTEMKILLQEAGFESISVAPWKQSLYAELNGLESRPFHDEIIIEAIKE